MTLPEIISKAEKKYKILPKDCRITRARKREQKKLYIERLVREFGLVNEVNS